MNEVKKILRRLSLFYWLAFLLGIIIVSKIISLQLFEYTPNEPPPTEISAMRGNILAYDGRVLATSQTLYEIRADFKTEWIQRDLKEPKDEQKRKYRDSLLRELPIALAGYFKDKSAEEYRKEIDRAIKSTSKNTKNFREEKIAPRDVNYLELQEIKKFPLWSRAQGQGGFLPKEHNKREYPYQSARRTIGDIDTAKNISFGIEGYFDEYLRGKPGKRTVQKTDQGWVPVNSQDDEKAIDGYDVVSTIDINIQDAVEVALKKQLQENDVFEGGTAMVMEVETGEVRAIANFKKNANGTFGETYNYAISERSDPGSTFKLVTLIALLEDGHVDLNTIVNTEDGKFTYNGKTYEDEMPPHGLMPLLKAAAKSSNVALVKLAIQYYKGKEEELVKHVKRMGLDSRFNLQIKEEEGLPHIPFIHKKGSWSNISLTQTAVGYEVMLAPIHTLALYNAVANNGKLVKPKFVTEVQQHGQTVKTFPTEVICSSICSSSTLQKVKTILEAVVEEETGSGKRARSDIYQVAGKTGTAQILFEHTTKDNKGNPIKKMVYGVKEEKEGGKKTVNKKHQPSFVGYFPADNPKYSAIVVLYTKKTTQNFYGGTWAAPVFKEFADVIYASHPEWHDAINKSNIFADLPKVKGGKSDEVNSVLNELDIPSNIAANTEWIRTKSSDGKIETVNTSVGETVPSVISMGLKDALYILENMGLNVHYTGKGSVKSQSIQPGTKVVRGQNITLTLEV